MIKELSTMALVAVLTTNISNHFEMVMGAAQDISGVYQAASVAGSPQQFAAATKDRVTRLTAVADRVQTMDLAQEVGPFGVVMASK